MICIVLGTTDVRVGKASRGFWRSRQGATVQPVFEDGFETLIGAGPERESPLAGSFESLGAIVLAQPHDASTGTKTLVRMGP